MDDPDAEMTHVRVKNKEEEILASFDGGDVTPMHPTTQAALNSTLFHSLGAADPTCSERTDLV